MLVFGYVIYCIICVWLTIGYGAATIVSKGLTGDAGGFVYHLGALAVIILFWYGAYSWFPFQVSVVQV